MLEVHDDDACSHVPLAIRQRAAEIKSRLPLESGRTPCIALWMITSAGVGPRLGSVPACFHLTRRFTCWRQSTQLESARHQDRGDRQQQQPWQRAVDESHSLIYVLRLHSLLVLLLPDRCRCWVSGYGVCGGVGRPDVRRVRHTCVHVPSPSSCKSVDVLSIK